MDKHVYWFLASFGGSAQVANNLYDGDDNGGYLQNEIGSLLDYYKKTKWAKIFLNIKMEKNSHNYNSLS